MKAVLLTAAAVLAFGGVLFAQNLPPDYNWELGVNAGWSPFTRPLGPATAYQGTSTRTSHERSFRFEYIASPHWMLNLELGDRHWESYGNWQLTDQQGQQLDNRKVTFVEADHAINESVGISYMIPFYTRYTDYNKANLYFGVNVGMMQTVNDGSIGYGSYKASPDSNYRYVNRYDYSSGSGFTFGLQMGYTWYIIPRLGLNLDLGVRYARVTTNDMHYSSENNKFYLLYFPETLGLRWRF